MKNELPLKDQRHFERVRKLALEAMCKDLRDYPWRDLDLKTLQKIHATLPPAPEPRRRKSPLTS